MKRRLLVCLLITAVIYSTAVEQRVLVFSQTTRIWIAPKIEIFLGRGVKETSSCYEIINSTRSFTDADEAIYVVVKGRIPEDVPRRTYTGILTWYAPPNGTVVYKEERISGLKRGYVWCIWRRLEIGQIAAENLFGTWKVRFSISGLKSRSVGFTLSRTPASSTGRSAPKPGTPEPRIREPSRPPGESWPEITEWAKPAVPFVIVWKGEEDEKGNKVYTLGSGVVVSPDGYILTAAHVAAGAREIKIVLNGQTMDASLVKVHPSWRKPPDPGDVALLKLKNPPNDLFWLPLGDSSKIKIGEEVVVLGYPLPDIHEKGIGIVGVTGIIQGLRWVPEAEVWLIQHNAPTDKGHSGGPLINIHGEVVGINYRAAGEHAEFRLAVAINTAKELFP